jgi:hypothetical protein
MPLVATGTQVAAYEVTDSEEPPYQGRLISLFRDLAAPIMKRYTCVL